MPTAKQLIESMPARFKSKAAPSGYRCRVHIQLRGADSGQYTVEVASGACTVASGLQGVADAKLDADAETYVAVALGKQRIEWAVLRGRISLSPIGTMRTFSSLFTPPTA